MEKIFILFGCGIAISITIIIITIWYYSGF